MIRTFSFYIRKEKKYFLYSLQVKNTPYYIKSYDFLFRLLSHRTLVGVGVTDRRYPQFTSFRHCSSLLFGRYRCGPTITRTIRVSGWESRFDRRPSLCRPEVGLKGRVKVGLLITFTKEVYKPLKDRTLSLCLLTAVSPIVGPSFRP